MALEILVVPCRADNYAYLLHDGAAQRTAVIDAPDAAPIEAALTERDWDLDMILITHHHDDHVAGVARLRDVYGATVVGAAADRRRLPPLDLEVRDGDTVALGDNLGEVLEVPGHTVGHVAYHFATAGALFSADSLMVMGCGRLFEGTPEQMWSSLVRMAALPDATQVYSGHEYAEANMRFALDLEPDNAALRARATAIAALREAGRPTVPAQLDLERMTNPFLRADDPALRARLGLEPATDAEVFAEVRRRKDAF